MNADEHELNELSKKIIGAAFEVSNVHARNFKIATKARRHEEKNLVTWRLHGRKKSPNA